MVFPISQPSNFNPTTAENKMLFINWIKTALLQLIWNSSKPKQFLGGCGCTCRYD